MRRPWAAYQREPAAAPSPDDEPTDEIPARVVQAEAKRARRRARNLRRVGVR